MSILPPLPEGFARQAGLLTPYEQQRLWEAALLMSESRGLLVRLAALFGRQIENVGGTIFSIGEKLFGHSWVDFEKTMQESVEDALWRGYHYATFGLEAAPAFIRPKQPRKNTLHKVATTASGVASGFVGFAGVLVDIPFTTATILRSIAEIARDSGEDLSAEDTKRACLEVLAFGNPGGADDEAETGYWAARLGMNHLTIHMLIRSAAAQFGMVLSEKMLAQTVPLAGAVAGGLLNYNFTDYYQSMAKVHFCVRALERRTGDTEGIKRQFSAMVQAARERRRLGKSRLRMPPALLPRS